MKFTLTFDCDNDAFVPDAADEIVRILRRIADDIEQSRPTGAVIDLNDNRVGEYALVGSPAPKTTEELMTEAHGDEVDP